MTDKVDIQLNGGQTRKVRDALYRACERYRRQGRDTDLERAQETREAVKAAHDAFGGFAVGTDRERAMQMNVDVLAGALEAEREDHNARARAIKRVADEQIWPSD